MNWQDLALCTQVGQEVFHPGPGNNVAEAKRICARCEVTEECLEAALGFGPTLSGVWGGTTQLERVTLRRQAKAAARASAR